MRSNTFRKIYVERHLFFQYDKGFYPFNSEELFGPHIPARVTGKRTLFQHALIQKSRLSGE